MTIKRATDSLHSEICTTRSDNRHFEARVRRDGASGEPQRRLWRLTTPEDIGNVDFSARSSAVRIKAATAYRCSAGFLNAVAAVAKEARYLTRSRPRDPDTRVTRRSTLFGRRSLGTYERGIEAAFVDDSVATRADAVGRLPLRVPPVTSSSAIRGRPTTLYSDNVVEFSRRTWRAQNAQSATPSRQRHVEIDREIPTTPLDRVATHRFIVPPTKRIRSRLTTRR
jgi:hypothetical protein